jgi:Flp pilus assembly protein TadD
MALVEQFKVSNQPAFLDTYGWLSYRLAKFDNAVPALEKAVELAPEFSVFRYHLGMAYHAVNRDAAALRELTQVIESKNVDFSGIDEARTLVDQLNHELESS